ncbi:DNA polymerase domain-containing protein [Brevibacillus sp. SYP-B805]|uniref:non-homologous end-joining DNA ligase n=1 Tax=Brevibacillus sp. SYP-B805 TaxID=1578199 RepID=UPI0013ED9A58|nr:non-homologous end-joining DNA ligase [Brevibacillus sp. SYP-B805]NGQ93868.1 DNA polymerase domain-containing protein [Brevibacillus sp. SYP-B805]
MPEKRVNALGTAVHEYTLTVEDKQLSISNPDKPLWPEAGVTKLAYIQYLMTVAPVLLPYTRNRLLTVIRYPHGIHDKSFYQKNLPAYAPEWIPTHTWESTRYPLLNDLPTLVWLANQAALEWHVSFHEAGNEIPTELVFDLDPSTPEFGPVQQAALRLKELLDELQLPSYVKTSGASGLQVYVPIERRYSFAQTRLVGEFVARYLTARYPRELTIERLIKNRGTKLYIDYLQHWRGKTLPAPYSTRAKPEATVSTPLTWEEVPQIHPTQFTVHHLPARLQERGDLFRPLLSADDRASLDPILSFLKAKSR